MATANAIFADPTSTASVITALESLAPASGDFVGEVHLTSAKVLFYKVTP